MTAILPRREVHFFSIKMEEKLRENDHKGGWKNCNVDFLVNKKLEETTELIITALPLQATEANRLRLMISLKDLFERYLMRALDQRLEGKLASLVDEAADDANIAMMFADNNGGLDSE